MDKLPFVTVRDSSKVTIIKSDSPSCASPRRERARRARDDGARESVTPRRRRKERAETMATETTLLLDGGGFGGGGGGGRRRRRWRARWYDDDWRIRAPSTLLLVPLLLVSVCVVATMSTTTTRTSTHLGNWFTSALSSPVATTTQEALRRADAEVLRLEREAAVTLRREAYERTRTAAAAAMAAAESGIEDAMEYAIVRLNATMTGVARMMRLSDSLANLMEAEAKEYEARVNLTRAVHKAEARARARAEAKSKSKSLSSAESALGTHYEIEIISSEVFIAVWDGAIDVQVATSDLAHEVTLGEGEDFSYAKIDEAGEVTELLVPPVNFNNLMHALDERDELESKSLETLNDAGHSDVASTNTTSPDEEEHLIQVATPFVVDTSVQMGSAVLEPIATIPGGTLIDEDDDQSFDTNTTSDDESKSNLPPSFQALHGVMRDEVEKVQAVRTREKEFNAQAENTTRVIMRSIVDDVASLDSETAGKSTSEKLDAMRRVNDGVLKKLRVIEAFNDVAEKNRAMNQAHDNLINGYADFQRSFAQPYADVLVKHSSAKEQPAETTRVVAENDFKEKIRQVERAENATAEAETSLVVTITQMDNAQKLMPNDMKVIETFDQSTGSIAPATVTLPSDPSKAPEVTVVDFGPSTIFNAPVTVALPMTTETQDTGGSAVPVVSAHVIGTSGIWQALEVIDVDLDAGVAFV